jgi:hypothetical protein
MSLNFCKKHINTFSDKLHRLYKEYSTYKPANSGSRQFKNVHLAKNENNSIQSGYKRGVFNFTGGISKILFDTL